MVTLHRGVSSSLDPTPAIDAAHGIVEDVFLLHEPKATVVREVSILLRDAPCYRLSLADPRGAAVLLRDLAARV